MYILKIMKSVIDYIDYRRYIQDYYEERKAMSYTWRRFASDAGFGSPVYLKYVCDGKKNLSPDAVEHVAKAMSLTGFELKYFRELVNFNHAKDGNAKKEAADKMMAIAVTHKIKVLGADEFRYFDSWKNPVIRELAPAMPGAKPLEIAHVCGHGITAAEVSETLSFLVQAGFLTKDENGHYHQSESTISTGKASFVPLAVRKMHRQMGEFALDALDNIPLEKRKFTGVTMGLTKEAYEQILKILDNCRRQIMGAATSTSDTECVYRLNIQFFPMTGDIADASSKEPNVESCGEKVDGEETCGEGA